jgi:transposase
MADLSRLVEWIKLSPRYLLPLLLFTGFVLFAPHTWLAIFVLDNLSSHKGGRVKEIVEQRGCELMYLPPYSPDLNPIEQAFSKVKGLMRKAEARTREALIEAMGRALDAVTSGDAQGFFSHCGYRPMDQLL